MSSLEQRKRVVITGMGVLSPFGQGVPAFKAGLLNGKTAIKPSPTYSCHYDSANAAEIRDPVTLPSLRPDILPSLDKSAQWALLTTLEALEQSGIAGCADILRTAGLVIGVSSAGTEAYMPLIENKVECFSARKLRYSGAFASCCPIVASMLGIEGGFELVATACTASTNAIGLGFDNIQSGRNQVVVVSGTEPLYLPTFAGFFALGAMNEGPCSPFSGRPGMSIGEGAGSIVLEEYGSAVARGATILAELAGYATSGDAFHETAPDPRANGAVNVMRKAMANAGVTIEDIDYINAHGTGTEVNDRSESLAIEKVFGHRARQVPVSSTKSYFGHTIGAAGIVELIACLSFLPEGKVLPTLNFTIPREGLDLQYVANEPLEQKVDTFIKNNYAFGGNNCSLVISLKPERYPLTHYNRQRVFVTGVGMISALGIGANAGFDAAEQGVIRSRVQVLGTDGADGTVERAFLRWMEKSPDLAELVGDIPLDKTRQIGHRVYDVEAFNPRQILKGVDFRKLNRVSTFALIGAELALQDAGLKQQRESEGDLGMIFGMSKGPQGTISRFINSLALTPRNIRTVDFPPSLMNSPGTICSIAKGIRGYNTTLATGYHASVGALMYGADILRQDLQLQMIVGGADENMFGPLSVVSTHMAGGSFELGQDAQRAYSSRPSGYCTGEGGAMIVLESSRAVAERGAVPLAELVGMGRANCSGFFDGGLNADALVTAIRAALAEAQLEPEQIDVIFGNSWGSAASDAAEVGAVRKVFGAAAAKIPFTNYSSYYGLVEAAGAAMSVVGAIDALRNDRIMPIPFTTDFVADDIAFVRGATLKGRIDRALVMAPSNTGNCYAFILARPHTGT